MQLEIDDTVADQLVRSRLIQDYRLMKQLVEELEARKDLADYQKLDLQHNLDMLASLYKVIEYYSTQDQMQEFEASL